MFADYRVPQQLQSMGILVYTPALTAKVPRHRRGRGTPAHDRPGLQGTRGPDPRRLPVPTPHSPPFPLGIAPRKNLLPPLFKLHPSLPKLLNHASLPPPSPAKKPTTPPQVASGLEIPAGSEEEVEIRAATVQAVEMMHALLEPRHVGITRVTLDWLLWTAGERNERALPPHHRALTCYY